MPMKPPELPERVRKQIERDIKARAGFGHKSDSPAVRRALLKMQRKKEAEKRPQIET